MALAGEAKTTPARRSMLRRIFQSLDADHDGELSGSELEQLRRQFSGTGDSRVQSGEITETMAFKELLAELLGDDLSVRRDRAPSTEPPSRAAHSRTFVEPPPRPDWRDTRPFRA